MKRENFGLYKGEKTGTLYTVLKITRLTNFRSLSGQLSELEGSYEFKTDCGMNLNETSEDHSKYETVNLSGENETIVKI